MSPQAQKRTRELESHLDTAIDCLRREGLIMKCPQTFQKYVFSRANGMQVYAEQLRRTIDKAACGRDYCRSTSTDHFARAMAGFLPQVQNLAKYEGSERAVFDLLLHMGDCAIGDQEDTKISDEFSDWLSDYAELDAALVKAIKRLKKSKLALEVD